MNQQRHWAHRVRNMIAVVLVACGVMAVSATVASAEGKCSGNSGYTICFYITPDINIDRLDAEAILAQPREHIDAWAIGDGWFDNAEFRIPLTWIAAAEEPASTAASSLRSA